MKFDQLVPEAPDEDAVAKGKRGRAPKTPWRSIFLSLRNQRPGEWQRVPVAMSATAYGNLTQVVRQMSKSGSIDATIDVLWKHDPDDTDPKLSKRRRIVWVKVTP
jgi:hypothetical protein